VTIEPQYQRVANTLIAQIKAGEYAVDTHLPTERDLCKDFGVSRHTTREALRLLEEKGLITRRQGSGSKVVAIHPPVRYEQNVQNIDDLMQHGNASRLHVLSSAVLEPGADEFASQITLQAKTPCIQVRSIRYPRNDARPLALVDVYVAVRSKAQARRLLDLDSAAQEIVSTVDVRKIDRIEQAFGAINVKEAQARLLHVAPSDAVFRIVRHYYDATDRLLVVAHSLYHGMLYTYASTLRRS
jgi:DNA-binding GntR family transcriptional regulator